MKLKEEVDAEMRLPFFPLSCSLLFRLHSHFVAAPKVRWNFFYPPLASRPRLFFPTAF